MQGLAIDVQGQAPYLLVGALVGLAAFAVLLLALVPVLRHVRSASMLKGGLSIAASFSLLMAGTALAYLLAPGAILAFLGGELAGFFTSWIVLACAVIVRA